MKDNVAKMNLQFFADGGNDGGQNPTGTIDGAAGNAQGTEGNQTNEELIESIADKDAEIERLKNAVDNLTKKNKNLTQANRDNDQAKVVQKAASDAKDARIAELEAKERMRDYAEIMMDERFKMEKKKAKEVAQMIVDGDFEGMLEMLGNHLKTANESSFNEGYQQFLKERPDVAAGNGNSDKNSAAIEMATASARRMGGVNENILKQYSRR